MPHAPSKLTYTTTWLAATLSVLVGLLLPLGYFALTHQHQTASMESEANVNAMLVTRLINANPDLWRFEEHRLADILEHGNVPGSLPELRRIIDIQNNLVAQSTDHLAPPIVTRSALLFDSGQAVGELQILRSFRPVLLNTAVVAFFSIFFGSIIYITLRVFPLRALQQSVELQFQEKERARVTLHSIGDAVITTDSKGHIEYLNPVAEELTGWSNEEAHELPLPRVFHLINETTGEPLDNPIDKVLTEGCIVPLASHIELLRRNGTTIPIEDSAAPIRDRAGQIIGVVLVFHDVSSAREMKQRLAHQAMHDTLTNLFNRREFEHRVEQALLSAKNLGLYHAMCYLDLDQFKIVNDTCGHIAGDELLRQLSTLLKSAVREADTLARLGGDEFGLLLMSCSLNDAEGIVDNLLEKIRNFRFIWHDKAFTVGLSAGLVPITAESGDVAQILSAADATCYMAKEAGRNRVQVYRANDTALAQRRGEMNWVTRLTEALDTGRFCLYRQTIMPLFGEPGDHFEVLIRMHDETGQLVSPGAFIPAAERYNLMSAIDRWVVKTTFSTINERYGDNGGKDLHTCAINLSGLSLNDSSFPEFIQQQAALLKIPHRCICFEITETAAIANLSKATEFMKHLKKTGFRFSLDDFGSGLSSFAYLKNLPIDYLKIDGGFVRGMLDDALDCSIVEAVNKIGHTIGIKTIAEFAENKALLKKLHSIGVDYAQGYGVAHPEPFPLD